ncbi:MAG TPA: hypothetical protein VHO25_20865, partial [Polyangiaceae bacterium]|nr:hypothetical protein [Polyangiaceae bacterium]
HVLHAEGDLLETFGSPIPGERVGAFRGHSDDEDEIEEQPSVLDDAHALCAHLGFELWRTPPVAGPGHSWTRRPFLSRLFTRNPA